MRTIRYIPLAACIAAVLFVAGCASTNTMDGNMMDRPEVMADVNIDMTGLSDNNTIVENAMAVGDLSSLVMALQAAGLAETLSGPGPYTVFAPINAAFDRADMMDMSMEAKKNTLLYHVIEGNFSAGQLSSGMTLVSVSGEELQVTSDDNNMMNLQVDGADIIYSDIESSNGTIHLINVVLDPTLGGNVIMN